MRKATILFERFTQVIFGKPEDYSLEHRFFNASCLVATLASIFATIINVALNISMILSLSTIGLSLLFIGFYWISLIKKKFKSLVLPFILTSSLGLIILWFINAGSEGPIAYVLILAMFVYVVITRGSVRIVALITVLITVSVLFIYDYIHPEAIVHYTDKESRFYDLFLTAFVSIGLAAMIASFFIKSYHDEKEQVLKHRDKILNQNKEISFHKEHLEDLVKKRTTELEETNIKLTKAKEDAEESDRLKSAFLSNMSHEIRTPMNAIIGFTELLKEAEIEKETFDNYIDIISSKGNILLNIINDIIDISKVEAGEIAIHESAFDVNKVIDELFTTFHKVKSQANKVNIELKVVKQVPTEKLMLFADQLRLKQVMSNLIDNAIKFTQKGSIEIGYSIINENKQKRIKFYVKDTGLGISDDHLEIIFNRFRQVDDSHTRKFGGTGLGLAISKSLVDLLGGELYLETEFGIGSTFIFTIPYKETHETKHNSDQKEPEKKEYSWSDKLILIAEDNHSSFLLLKSYLLNTGAKIIHTGNGKDAVEICKSNTNVDLVLMDIELHGINGYMATKLIKQNCNNLPVISQTAYAMTQDTIKSREAGCDDHIVKPISKEIFLQVLSKYLD